MLSLQPVSDELRFVLITSAANIEPMSAAGSAATVVLETGQRIAIAASKATGEKCERCWHIRPDVGQHEAHPALCGRCVENVDGEGEQRRFA